MENHEFLMGKSTISMAIFNSKLFVYQRVDSMKSPFSSYFNHHCSRSEPGTGLDERCPRGPSGSPARDELRSLWKSLPHQGRPQPPEIDRGNGEKTIGDKEWEYRRDVL